MRLDSISGALTHNVFNQTINPFVITFASAIEPAPPTLFITTENGIPLTTENGIFLTTE